MPTLSNCKPALFTVYDSAVVAKFARVQQTRERPESLFCLLAQVSADMAVVVCGVRRPTWLFLQFFLVPPGLLV